MNEMHFEGCVVSSEAMLAMSVEVELHQVVANTTHDQVTAGLIVDLDCMTVVDEIERRRLIVKA